MNYVNAYGEPISIGSRQSHVAAKKVRVEPIEKKHMGFQAVGFGPEHVAEAKAAHDAKRLDDDSLGEFNANAWMNGAKKKPGQKKPFATPEAAGLLGRMLESAGWVRVEVLPIIR